MDNQNIPANNAGDGQVKQTQPTQQTTSVGALANNQRVSGGYESNPFVASAGGLVTILKNNPVSAMAANIVALLLIFAVAIIFGLFSVALASSKTGGIIILLLYFVIFAAIMPIIMGVNLSIAAASIEGLKLRTGDALRASFGKILPILGLLILLGLGGALGLVLFVVPGIIFLVRSSLAPLIVFTEDAGPITALKRSFQLTKGHFFEMFGASIASTLLCAYGLIAPVAAVAAVTTRYQQFKALPSNSTVKYEVHWLNYVLAIIVSIIVVAYVGFFVAIFAFGSRAAKNTTTYPTYDTNTLYQNNSSSDSFYNNSYYNNSSSY